jgi:hypothetical protein
MDTAASGTVPVTGWDAYQAIIDLARRHELPVPNTITVGRVHVDDYRQVLAWAEAFNATTEVTDGSRGGQDRILACVRLPDVGLGDFFDVLGSTACPYTGTDHDHIACVAAAAARR